MQRALPVLPLKPKPNINKVKDMMKLLPHDLWLDRAFRFLQIEKFQHSFFEHAELLPFDSNAQSFSFANAWYLSEAAYLAYAEENYIHEQMAKVGHEVNFQRSKSWDGEGFISFDDENVFVVFRGTEAVSFQDYVTDARVGFRSFWKRRNKSFIHEGFDALFKKMARDNQLYEQLAYLVHKGGKRRTVWFTGHSLGGALANVAAYYAKKFQVLKSEDIRLYTYGAPRVGNQKFASAVDFPAYRIVHHNDIVSRVPPPIIFRHAGQLVFIGGGGHKIEVGLQENPEIQIYWMKKNLAQEDTKFTSIFAGIESWYLSRMDELLDPLLDHAPVYYSIYLWNYMANNPQFIASL